MAHGLGVAPDRGHRRPQLMAGVSDEVPQAFLGVAPRDQARLDVVEHVVEGQAQLTHFGRGVRGRDPRRKHRISVGQRCTSHLSRGGRHAGERPQREPDQPATRGDRRQQHDGEDRELNAKQLGQGLMDRVERQADHDAVSIADVKASQPVVTENAKITGLRMPHGQGQEQLLLVG